MAKQPVQAAYPPQRVTNAIRKAYIFGDMPVDTFENWIGYVNMKEKTLLPLNVLTAPSQNCIIPQKDVITPRTGSLVLGQTFTEEAPILGNATKYNNIAGTEMEVRAWNSTPHFLVTTVTGSFAYNETITGGSSGATATLLYILNGVFFLSNITGTFSMGETITGGTSGATAVVSTITVQLRDVLEALYTNTVTGITSWVQLTETLNPLSVGANNPPSMALTPLNPGRQRFYFDSWFDTTVNTANGTIPSLNLPRLVWVNGIATIFSWSGGIVTIESVSGNNLIIDSSTTWEAQGFIDPADGGTGYIVVNGVKYQGTGGWATDTLTVTSSSGISTNNVATALIETDSAPIPFNMCCANDNYMYYGSWKSQLLYQSNGHNKDATEIITYSQAAQNDLVVTGNYTGTGTHTYTVTIDSVHPATDNQTFTSYTGGSGTSFFNTTRYVGIGLNNYRMSIISNLEMTPNGSSIAGTFYDGQTLKGGTSGAIVVIVEGPGSGGSVVSGAQFNLLSGNPQVGEVFTDINDSGNHFVVLVANRYNSAQIFRNGVQVTDLTGMLNDGLVFGVLQFALVGDQVVTPAQLDGLQFSTTQVGGDMVGDYYSLQIQKLSPDTFQVQVDGAAAVAGETGIQIQPATAVLTYTGLTGTFMDNELVSDSNGSTGIITIGSQITGGFSMYNVIGDFGIGDTITGRSSGATAVTATYVQTPASQQLYQIAPNGVTISFASSTGHNLGDTWTVTVNQGVTRGWANFYYTLPLNNIANSTAVKQTSVRQPGEGYKLTLPQNFWTMRAQEGYLYTNTSGGKWGYVLTTLSSDLQSETVTYTGIQSITSSKVLYPYLTGTMDSNFVFITTDYHLMMFTRNGSAISLVNIPKVGDLSDIVRADFERFSWINGSIAYNNEWLMITSPQDGVMMLYDNHAENQYWQPPQVFPENGLLSIVGSSTISHSTMRNQTNTLYTGYNGDNGENYLVIARTGYWGGGNRWSTKSTNTSYIDGYMIGTPPIEMNLYSGVNGCRGIKNHQIQPILCLSPDDTPLGEASLGYHPLGSSNPPVMNYFQESWNKMGSILDWYLLAAEITCNASNQQWSVVTMGVNRITSNKNNALLRNQSVQIP